MYSDMNKYPWSNTMGRVSLELPVVAGVCTGPDMGRVQESHAELLGMTGSSTRCHSLDVHYYLHQWSFILHHQSGNSSLLLPFRWPPSYFFFPLYFPGKTKCWYANVFTSGQVLSALTSNGSSSWAVTFTTLYTVRRNPPALTRPWLGCLSVSTSAVCSWTCPSRELQLTLYTLPSSDV